MNVLVTGGAGFIGRTMVRMLVEKGHKVVSIDNFRFSDKSHLVEHPNVDWVWGDTRNEQLVSAFIRGKDAVIHLAAPSSFLMHEENDFEASEFTLMGFKMVMELAKRVGIRKVVWASTSAVYERNPVPYREDMTLDPPDSKAGCKLFCEQEARRYSERYGIRSIAMRPFSVYGAGEHTKRGYANVISLFAWAMMRDEPVVVWGDGSQTRDYIFVDDAARGFISALEALDDENTETQALNLGTGIETTFNEVIDIIADELGVAPKKKYVPVPIKIYAERLLADMTKVKQVLGFEPRISVREGIQRVIEVTRSLPEELQLKLAQQQHYYLTLHEPKDESRLNLRTGIY